MKERETYFIKGASDLLGIPQSTLRYWEGEGLIWIKRDEQNDYRQFSVQSVIDISDVAFFRNLDVPVRELKNLFTMSLEELDATLKGVEQKVEQQYLELEQKKERIERQRYFIKLVEQLQKKQMCYGEPDLNYMIPFQLDCRQHWEETIKNPYYYGIVMEKENNWEVMTGIVEAETSEKKQKLLWKKENGKNKKYIETILMIQSDKIGNNNIEQIIKEANKMGIKPRRLIGRFLVSGFDRIRWDYYRVWLEE